MIIYEYLRAPTRGVLSEYLERLDAGDKGRLEARLQTVLDAVSREKLPPNLLVGPFRRGRSYPEIYKLRVNGPTKAMRLFCALSTSTEGAEELTVLSTAYEQNSNLVPWNAPDQALERLTPLKAGMARRIEWETDP